MNPHPTHQQHLPDDAVLVDRFAEWIPEDSRRRQILVDNPQVLYRF
jgi:predicted TIM-barrel fold metal-dependent hydrolase